MTPAPSFRERLVPPWWIPIVLLLLVVPAVLLVFLPIDITVGIAVAIGLYAGVLALLWVAAPVVEVQGGVLRAGRARIDVVHLGTAHALEGAEATAAMRGGWDPTDHHVISPWTRAVVRARVDDPTDSTGAWLVSSRRPQRLAAAIEAARDEQG